MDAQFHLPDILANWPWPRLVNPHYQKVSVESDAWFRSLHAFGPKAQTAFEACNFGLLAALAYPKLSEEHLRTACDLMNLFFAFDEYTDAKGPEVVGDMVDVVMDAIRDPYNPRPEGEIVLGEIARQFWARAVLTASPTFQERFVEVFQSYTSSVVEEAKDRVDKNIRSVDEYMELRRLTSGAMPCFAVIELGMDLPAEAFHHPIVQSLRLDAADLIILINDLYSYNREQARGDTHNLLSVIMRHERLDLNGAIAWLKAYSDEKIAHTLDIWEQAGALSWGPRVDTDMTEYLQGLIWWIRAIDTWHFESTRYFGVDGLAIQKHRMVTLMPRS
ncbi:hypothetical protein CERSUDRAFT_96486 [Gelatoporia subvermispora B]|uniref:Terpene synthase n=1 Tax=Ceriporiopsis subvermispora (strain B) TaxID=914234 RepID=M2PH56_CERS8|nr:hypothetical protein CERSUDRAFT_96486 [Gelatoporia subvermispora B]